MPQTTFLPDWQMADLEFQRDEPLCQDAVDKSGNKLYHKASRCPAPKGFDEHCAHDDRYISECYCPTHYQYDCVSPYRGDERVKKNGYACCDGLYIACCDGSCPGNTSKSYPGECGGSTSDGCGGTRTCCTACPPPPSPPSTSSSGGGSSSGSGSSGSSSSSSSGSSQGSTINSVLQRCGVGSTTPRSCPSGQTLGYIEYACHRGHSNHVNFDCRDGQYYCEKADGTKSYFNRFEWPDGC